MAHNDEHCELAVGRCWAWVPLAANWGCYLMGFLAAAVTLTTTILLLLLLLQGRQPLPLPVLLPRRRLRAKPHGAGGGADVLAGRVVPAAAAAAGVHAAQASWAGLGMQSVPAAACPLRRQAGLGWACKACQLLPARCEMRATPAWPRCRHRLAIACAACTCHHIAGATRSWSWG